MTKDKSELMGSLKREKKRNYVILYTVTLAVWLLLVAYSFLKGFFNGGDFVVNVVNNIIGILPPILIFDFFNEKLTKESDTIEMSNQITETLMSNPETLELFSEEQKKNFIRSAVCSVVRDPDAADMLNDTLEHYLSGKVIGKIRTSFDYDFVLEERLPAVYETLLEKQENYFYVQEKLCYTVKYLTEQENNAASNLIKIGFTFDNKDLDNVLRERKTNDDFENCIFRESLDLKKEDLEKVKTAAEDLEMFQKLFKMDLQIDRFKGRVENVRVSQEGIVCTFRTEHDPNAQEHTIRIIFHMPKRWGSSLEVALVDPVRAPRITVSYPEDVMDVEMFSFLSKGEESSLEVAHEHLNGIYDISLNSEWVYPISGMVFCPEKKTEQE